MHARALCSAAHCRRRAAYIHTQAICKGGAAFRAETEVSKIEGLKRQLVHAPDHRHSHAQNCGRNHCAGAAAVLRDVDSYTDEGRRPKRLQAARYSVVPAAVGAALGSASRCR